MQLCIQDLVVDGNKIWFTIHDMAAILKYDINENYCEIENILPGHYLSDKLIIGPIHKVDNILILAPIRGGFIYLYDINKKRYISSIENTVIGELQKDRLNNENEYYGKIQGKDYAVFLGKGKPCVAVFRNYAVDIFRVPYEMDRNMNGTFNGYFGSNAAIFLNKVYIPMCNTTKIFVFDLITNCFVKEYDCGEELITCCSDSEGMWMIPQNKGALKYINLYNNKLYVIGDYPEDFCGSEVRWFQSAHYCKDHIIIFPYKANMILRVNVHTHKIIGIRKFEDCNTPRYTHSGIFDEKRLWGFFQSANRLDIIDCHSWRIKSIFISYPVNILDMEEKRKKLLNCKGKVDEEFKLKFVSCGENIWREIKERTD